jgi:hypothetical protein
VKKPRLLLAALVLLIGAASAAGPKLPPGSNEMIFNQFMARSAR